MMGNILKMKLKTGESLPCREVIPNHCVRNGLNPNRKYLSNKIKTTKYTIWSFIPKNMFEQFHRFANMYFLFIVLLNWIPQVNAFGKEVAMIPVLFVLGVTAIKDAFEDYRRFKSDRKVNHMACRVYTKSEKRYVRREWKDITVGDIVHLSCNEVIPADVILLRTSDEDGICHIDTSNLDGENNLKQRHGIRKLNQGEEFHPTMFRHTIECEHPNMEIYKFHGTIMTPLQEKLPVSNNNLLLRGCIIRNTDFVEGIVVYAGHDTKALMNNRGPRYKRSRLERQINGNVVWCVILLILVSFLCALGTGLWLERKDPQDVILFVPPLATGETNIIYIAFLRFWTFVILYQVIVPLGLYVTLEIVKVGQVYFIENDLHLYHSGTDKQLECRALNITEDLGQVEHVFSDKTGTLTENKMCFKRCTIGGVSYCPPLLGDNGMSSISEDDVNRASMTSEAEGHATMEEHRHDPRLDRALSGMKLNDSADQMEDVDQEVFVQEFFLLMAICNTVVVSAQPHNDKMDASGFVHDETIRSYGSISQQSLDTSTYVDKEDAKLYPRVSASLTPTGSWTGRNSSVFNDTMTDGQDHDVSLSETTVSEVSARTLQTRYEAESPDEMALVQAACAYGCRLVRRSLECATVWMPGEGNVGMQIVHLLPFDSHRKRMSVIIQHPATGDFILYCKGADSAIFSCLKPKDPGDIKEVEFRQNTIQHLTNYAKEGLRTLCMAKKVIPTAEYKSWLRLHLVAENAIENRDNLLRDSACAIERNLDLLGATGIEDRLQDGVPETISALHSAGIKLWVLTGDKQETALNIAHSCHLMSFDHDMIVLNGRSKDHTRELIMGHKMRVELESDVQTGGNRVTPGVRVLRSTSDRDPKKSRALVIDGKTLAFALRDHMETDFLTLAQYCDSVLCCRVTPYQKAEVVKLVRDKLKKLTLAIGDGANDVSMIQTADIGIGISGQEGMQAVMASDFAMPRFRFLRRLLLVHGHWCYERLANMTKFMWYKNMVFIFMLMWHMFFNGFSATSFVDDLNLLFFNLIYTSLTPIMLGVFDQCASDHTLTICPHVYKDGPTRRIYPWYAFWINVVDALWQSVVLYFTLHGAYWGGSVGIWEFGMTGCAASVYLALIHGLVVTKHLNAAQWFAFGFSIFLFYFINLILGVFCTTCTANQNMYWSLVTAMGSAEHWFCIGLAVTVGILPRVVITALKGTFCPLRCFRAQIKEKREARHDGSYVTWSSSSSNSIIMQQSDGDYNTHL